MFELGLLQSFEEVQHPCLEAVGTFSIRYSPAKLTNAATARRDMGGVRTHSVDKTAI
jgi:hypothetical protein